MIVLLKHTKTILELEIDMRDYAKKESELQKEAVYWKEEGISDMREQI